MGGGGRVIRFYVTKKGAGGGGVGYQKLGQEFGEGHIFLYTFLFT